MRRLWVLSRRAFVRVTGLTLFVRTAAAGGVPVAALQDVPARGYEVLTEPQIATLEAICEQIIPQDEHPGAREAQIVRYIDRVLAGEQRERHRVYVAGLHAVDRTSTTMFGGAFGRLDVDRQMKVLRAIDGGKVEARDWAEVDSQEFFHTVWTHTLEGYYASPIYGGNADHASWRMIGYPVHPVKLHH